MNLFFEILELIFHFVWEIYNTVLVCRNKLFNILSGKTSMFWDKFIVLKYELKIIKMMTNHSLSLLIKGCGLVESADAVCTLSLRSNVFIAPSEIRPVILLGSGKSG